LGSKNRYDEYFGKTPATIIRRKARQLVRSNVGRAEETGDYEQELAIWLRALLARARFSGLRNTKQ